MKKIIAITAVVLVIIMSLTAFVACDKKGEEQEITADTKFEDIVSDKITEEELISMVQDSKNVDNFRVNSIIYMDDFATSALFEKNGDTTKTVEKLIEDLDGDFDDNVNYAHYSYSYIENGIKYRLYSRDNENWQREIIEGTESGNAYASLLEGYYVESYVGAEWSDEYKAYVEYNGGSDWLYKFKNNRLCAFAIYDKDDKRYDEMFVFYDFGKVPEITIPEITE